MRLPRNCRKRCCRRSKNAARESSSALLASDFSGDGVEIWAIPSHTTAMSTAYDIICIGAGPTGLATAIEAKIDGLRPLVIDKGCLCNSLFHYPVNMTFFTTPERMEIGALPMTVAAGKPTRAEALKYYRRAVEHFEVEVRQYERVERVSGHDGAFIVHTLDAEGQPQ